MSDQTARNLRDVISAAARRLEVELKGDARELRALGLQLTTDLSMAFGQEGFDEAAIAARDILALEMGIEATEIGDLADAELRGMILGFLTAAAGAA